MNAKPGAAGDNRPEAVTAEDIRGLRAETGRLADSLAAVKDTVAIKADADEVLEAKRLAKRANINSTLAAGALILAVVFGGLFWNAQRVQHNKDTVITHDRRLADCSSIAGFGEMAKKGITVISVPADRQADLDAFVKQYDSAIDTAVVEVRAQKGYSADCSVIGNPPKAGG